LDARSPVGDRRRNHFDVLRRLPAERNLIPLFPILKLPAMNRVRLRQFLVSLLAAYAVLAVAMGVNYAVLWRAGELRPLADIISQQDRKRRRSSIPDSGDAAHLAAIGD
jgi:hypothetical protein